MEFIATFDCFVGVFFLSPRLITLLVFIYYFFFYLIFVVSDRNKTIYLEKREKCST